ncbi:MAG: glycosyltransferase, partial [Actinomycetota bacterium]|nr:glycosyltransferase [Actinomycetota bacterium]
MRVVMILDYFFYYAAAIANALVDQADVLFVTRDHGEELGACSEATDRKRKLLDPRAELVVLRGRQSEPGSLSEIARVGALIRRFDPDIVHSQYHKD